MKSAMTLPVIVALTMLQACAGGPAPAQPAPPPMLRQGECQAAGASFAIGQAFNMPPAEDARQRAGALTVRALRPNQAVTMEFNAGRLNLELGAGDRVVRVRCG